MRRETKAEYMTRRNAEEEALGTYKTPEFIKERIRNEEPIKMHLAALVEIFVNDLARGMIAEIEYKNMTYTTELHYTETLEYVTADEWINEKHECLKIDVTGMSSVEMAVYLIRNIVEERWGRKWDTQ